LVVRNPDAALWTNVSGWQLRERFRVGTLEGDAPDVFGEIRDVELGLQGELYVLDSQAAEVRVFDDAGIHLRTFGRSGAGPGELRRPAGMALDSDGVVWIMNWGNARFSGFNPNTGELVAERRRMASYAIIPWAGRFDQSNQLLDTGLGTDGHPVILGLDSAFVPRDTLVMPRAAERDLVPFRTGTTLVMSAMVPFASQPTWSAHPSGGIVIGEGAAYRLHRVNFRGDTTMTIEVLRAPIPVSRQERDSAIAAFQEMSKLADGAQPDRQPEVPANKPAHGALFVDDRGYLWVRRTPVPGAALGWDVITADGQLLGTIAIPLQPSFVPPSVRGNRLAVVTTINDVPTVVVYEIVRPDGAT
jgi:hypothetical protein